jgi:single-strand DNA-binding protein
VSSIAQATIIGNLGKKPEIKQAGERRFARFSLAVNKKTKDAQTTSGFDVVVWDEKKVELLDQYADKGTKLMVSGDLERREYVKQDGTKGYSFEVVLGRFGGTMLLLPNGQGAGQGSEPARPQRAAAVADEDVPW